MMKTANHRLQRTAKKPAAAEPERWAVGRNMGWPELLGYFGGIAGITTFCTLVGRKAIDAYLSGRLEEHKSHLERQTKAYIIKFERLHTERATVIKEVYRKLVALDGALKRALSDFQATEAPPLEEQVREVARCFNELHDLYQPNRIFFKEYLCSTFDDLLISARGVFIDRSTYPIGEEAVAYQYVPGLRRQRDEFWEKARKEHGGNITKLKESLEAEFREVLGITA